MPAHAGSLWENPLGTDGFEFIEYAAPDPAALGRLFAVAEAYPELQADENFRQLQTELAETENRVAVARQVYNDSVLTYNNAIQTFPGLVLAGPFGFSIREFFEVEDEAQRQVPTVDF